MGETIQYRDFEIFKTLVSYWPSHDWTWAHKDFDLHDTRGGFAGSVEEAKRQIDEWHEENGAEA